MRVGIEVGGTFTDLVAIDGDRVLIGKVPSTPAAPDRGALDSLAAASIDLARVRDLVHGSTVATNAILERKGARLAFLVTEGFRDLLLLQRHDRKRIYDLFYQKPRPVVARRDTFTVAERMDAEGRALVPLDAAAEVQRLAPAIEAGGYHAIAILFLNSYANPAHEEALAAALERRFPHLFITCSTEVTREFREYERASTVTLSAYVQPVIDSYLARFADALGDRGFTGRFSVMQSNGGRMPAAGMAKNAITSLFSGPAAGVIGAVHQAGRSGYRNLITFDMGGTSTDVCLVRDGQPDLSTETEVDGLPIRTPVLDIVTVGAGGGSIVWVDDGGMLRIGPRSAGADPGPACYGRGGTEPTVTDAHLIRGSMRADAFLGGRMRIQPAAAERAFQGLASRFAQSLPQIADSAVRVADAAIVRAIQIVSTERGRDPRDFVLVPFGGAGPLHAARVAEELGIVTVAVPPHAGVISAFGLLAADDTQYETLTRKIVVGDGTAEIVREQYAAMRGRMLGAFRELGIAAAPRCGLTLAMRFVGQAFEVPVTLAEGEIERLDSGDLERRFIAAHHRVFAFGEASQGTSEIVSFRLGAASPPPSVPILAVAYDGPAVTAETRIFDRGAWRPARLLARGHCRVGHVVAGPALIEDATSTTYVPPGWRARGDSCDNLFMTRAE
ncbi:MAG: hydantoinase/oxoprolinase family protein [Alphaproteobacteria bacterium]|nr:hydantoinase/oxoprolinase family protein [Alphaproteobacteria bacterium]